jgi:pyrimidine oxygenase
MIIADETDEAAHAKFELYNQGTDVQALAWMKNQSGKDEKADKFSTAQRMVNMAPKSNAKVDSLPLYPFCLQSSVEANHVPSA